MFWELGCLFIMHDYLLHIFEGKNSVKYCVSFGKVKVVKDVTITKKFKDGSPLTMPGDKKKSAVLVKWGDEVTECVWMPPGSLQRDMARGEFLSGLDFDKQTFINLNCITSEFDSIAKICWTEVELDGKNLCAFRYINHSSKHVIIEHELKNHGVVFDSYLIPVEMITTDEEIIIIPEMMFKKQRLDSEPAFKSERKRAKKVTTKVYEKQPALNLNRESNKMMKAVRKSKVKALYHITHFENLSNILQYGLASHNLAHKNKLLSKDISLLEVNQLRNRKEPIFNRNLHDYVPLYFNPRNAMLYLRQMTENDLVILKLPNVLLSREGSIFTAGNAAAKGTRIYHSVEDFKKLPLDTIVDSQSWFMKPGIKHAMCAEVLVYERIDLPHIKTIYTKYPDLASRVKTLVGNDSHIKVKSDDSYFF